MLIQVTIRNVYGTERIYPANGAAQALCDIKRARTLELSDLLTARTHMGATVEVLGNGSALAGRIRTELGAVVSDEVFS